MCISAISKHRHHSDIKAMSGSVVFVLVGQCGNQLGEAILTRLFEAVDLGRVASPFFTREGKARCVLVDSEPKAITGVLERSEKRFGHLGKQFAAGGIFRRENVVAGESGRGNNWGLGYNGLSTRRPISQRAFTEYKDQRIGDSHLLERALCAVHAEGCRAGGPVEAIIVVHSLAGGTGSGFTSKLVEKLHLHFQLRTPVSETMGGYRGGRKPSSKYEELDEDTEAEIRRKNPWLMGEVVSDEDARRWETEEIKCRDADGLGSIYGERRKASYIVAFSVSPMKIGENAVQGINATLTLDSLLSSCHAIVVLRNDDALFNLPCPLTMPGGAEDAGSRGSTGTGVRRAAASSTSGTVFKPPATMEDINNVFASMVLVMFEFGSVFGTVDTLMRSTVPRATNPGAAPSSSPHILTLVPLPQRVFSKYAYTTHYSRLYRLPTDMFGAHLAPDFDSSYVSGAAVVPIEQIHIQQKPPPFTRGANRTGMGVRGVASQVSGEFTSDVNVPVPRCLFSMSKATSGDSYKLSCPLSLWPVLVLAQLGELNKEALFPLLSDCFMKVRDDAFIHLFEDTGVSPEFISAALSRVATVLSADEAEPAGP